jgi:hypothetical protein
MFYPKMHPSFTSSLNDLRAKIQSKSGRLSGHSIFSEALKPVSQLEQIHDNYSGCHKSVPIGDRQFFVGAGHARDKCGLSRA